MLCSGTNLHKRFIKWDIKNAIIISKSVKEILPTFIMYFNVRQERIFSIPIFNTELFKIAAERENKIYFSTGRRIYEFSNFFKLNISSAF